MAKFSFRAECKLDAQALFASIIQRAPFAISIYPDSVFPDVDIELDIDISIEQLKSLMEQIEDGHVMLETLRPEGHAKPSK